MIVVAIMMKVFVTVVIVTMIKSIINVITPQELISMIKKQRNRRKKWNM